MASYQTGPVTDASGQPREISQNNTADPVEILNGNLQAMFNEFLSQRPSAEGLYAAHVMFQELANGTYEHYCQQIRQEEQAGPQVGEENRWQIHDELPQQPFDDFQHGSHLLQQQSSVEESSAQSTPNLDPNEQPMVPDAVFIAESGRPYDLFWMEKWNIAPQQFQDLRSRMKFTDLFDRGVLQWDHDVLHFNSVTSAGCEVKRRFVLSKSQTRYSPVVKFLREDLENPWDSDLKEMCCGLNEILEFVKRCTNDKPRYKCLFYQDVSVSRNGAELGTLGEIRHKFHMWEFHKDLFTARSGLPGRRRRINKKTGRPSDYPGLSPRAGPWIKAPTH